MKCSAKGCTKEADEGFEGRGRAAIKLNWQA